MYFTELEPEPATAAASVIGPEGVVFLRSANRLQGPDRP